MSTTRCISNANYIIDQWNHNGFALYQPNYDRKIVLIMRPAFVTKKIGLLYCARNGYIFLPELFIKCAIADQRLHAVSIEFKKKASRAT